MLIWIAPNSPYHIKASESVEFIYSFVYIHSEPSDGVIEIINALINALML